MAVITLLGTIGADAKVNVISNDRFAINLSVCENVPVKNKDSEIVHVAQWFNVSYFSKSDKLARHLKKGKKVFVSGDLKFSEFKNENTGQCMKTNDIIASTLTPAEWEKNEETGIDPMPF